MRSTLTALGVVACLMAAGCVDDDNDPAPAPAPAPAAPTVLSIAPSSGPLPGGQLVTVGGSNFDPAASVSFGATPAAGINVVSATELVAVTPAGSAGSVDVVVTNPSSASGTLTNGYTYSATPVLLSVSPAQGPTAGGNTVTLFGSNFTSPSAVYFGAAAGSSVTLISSTTLTVVAPSGTAGTVNVTLTPQGLPGVLLSNAYSYSATGPTPPSITPTQGSAAGGTAITITGTGFQSGVTVTIAGVLATNVVLSGTTQITALTPPALPGASGVQTVAVTNPAQSPVNASPGFTYFNAPAESGSDPAATPDVAIDANGGIHVVWQTTMTGGRTDILYTKSTDGGQTFSALPRNLSNSTRPSARPRIASRGGQVFAVWNETVGGNEVVCQTHSIDYGATFTTPAGMVQTVGVSPDPDVAIGGNNNVMVVFRFANGTAPSGQPQIHIGSIEGYIIPIGGGPPLFMTPDTVAGGTIAAGPPCVAASGNNVWVAFHATSLGSGPVPQFGAVDLWLNRSTDGGGNYGTVQTLLNDGNDRHDPSIAVSGTTVVVSHLMTGVAPQSGTQTRCFVQYSSDSGASWSAAASLGTVVSTPLSPPGFVAINALDVPVVGVDGNGSFYAVWAEATGSPSAGDLFTSTSTDGGQNWSGGTSPTNLTATAGDSRTPQIIGRATGFFTVWADDTANSGTPDVLTR
jgi:hypothetical protein